MNPRVLRDQYASFVGKKVMIGLRNYHYVSCRIKGVSGVDMTVTINGREMSFPVDQIANIQDAPEEQSEFLK